MDTYRIDRTHSGWGLYRAMSQRPILVRESREAVLVSALVLLKDKKASLRYKQDGVLTDIRT